MLIWLIVKRLTVALEIFVLFNVGSSTCMGIPVQVSLRYLYFFPALEITDLVVQIGYRFYEFPCAYRIFVVC